MRRSFPSLLGPHQAAATVTLSLFGLAMIVIGGCNNATTSSTSPGTSTNATTPDSTPTESLSPAEETSEVPTSKESASEVEATVAVEVVELGTDELVSGIPGEGPLTLSDIENWLADERNHRVLEPKLPLGLAAGATEIVGLEENPLTRAKIELGRQLYFDTRLSADTSTSCATCHDPKQGYAAPTRFGVGIREQEGNRNSPTAYNRILSAEQFWDGRAGSLEEQAIGPIANPIEMGNTHEACTECLAGIAGYRLQFERIFEDGLTIENVGKALASFERVIVTGPTPWDYYERLANFRDTFAEDLEDLEALAEEDPELLAEYQELLAQSEAHPISESAIRGGELFFGDKARCSACHNGANFTDELYHNLGVGMDAEQPDLGRYEVTGDDADRGAFKTPTIRNVAQTAPYMHDGSQATLEEVVAWYNQGGHPNEWLSGEIEPLGLTDQEQADLVEFMRALTGELPSPRSDRLPE